MKKRETKNTILTPVDLRRFKEAEEVFHSFHAEIEDRVYRILKVIRESFGLDSDNFYWGFDDSEDGGTFATHDWGEEAFPIVWHQDSYSLFSTDAWDYGQDIPVKLLFMSDDEIRTLIKTQIEESHAKALAKKEKSRSSREAKKQAKAAALTLLTPQQKKDLGLK